jgi:type IV secretion system protein VirD4
LGGNEQATHKYVSEMLGKETIDTNTYGHSYGRNGNYSRNDQNAGRELMTPDEVRLMDNRYALLFIRGERPVLDDKLDILKHPNVGGSADGHGEPFYHGETDYSIASFTVRGRRQQKQEPPPGSGDMPEVELLSEEDLELQFKQEGKTS